MGGLRDDLVTRGVTGPDRVFTSRAEYRLSLRADNADQRLTPLGLAVGCVGRYRATRFAGKIHELETARERARGLTLTPTEARRHGLGINQDGVRRSVHDLLAYPEIDLRRLSEIWPELGELSRIIAEQLEADALYAGYLDRQQADIAAFRRDESLRIPDDLDYGAVGGLSTEVRQRLDAARPMTLGQAARLEGITPASLVALLAHVKVQRDGGTSDGLRRSA